MDGWKHLPHSSVLISMINFLLWLILLVMCWPLAVFALVLYPIVWVVMLPFKLIGITANALLELIKALFMLPSRVLRGNG